MRGALDALRKTEEPRLRELEESRATVKRLRAELAEHVETVRKLTTRQDELESALQHLRLQESEQADNTAALREHIASMRATESSASSALAEARAALEAQRNALAERDRTVARLREENEAMRADTARGGNAELARVMAELNQAIEDRDRAREEAQALRGKHRVNVGTVGTGMDRFTLAAREEGRRRRLRVLLSERGRNGERVRLGEILRHAGALTEKALQEALREQAAKPSQLLGSILVSRETVTEDEIAQAVACQSGLPLVEPLAEVIPREAAELVSRDVCAWHVCVPLRLEGDTLVLAMANPADTGAVRKVSDLTRCKVSPVVATPTDILAAIEDVYGVF